uniref:Protein kinase domain-containing protein n=1 Tax=Oryza brachyantha TaxID=4533 RepID=J3NA26_ORYBR
MGHAIELCLMAGQLAERFRDVQSRIDSYLLVYPFISHIIVTRRLDRIYNVLVPNDTPSLSAGSQPDVLIYSAVEKSQGLWSNPIQSTSNQPKETTGGSEQQLRRRDWRRQLGQHIVGLLGSCVARHKKRRPLLLRRRKINMDPEQVLVYEYMENGSLDDHLHGPPSSSSSPSPVMASWRMRIEILLGVSRAIEYLHGDDDDCGAAVVHRDIKPSNILLDSSWVSHLAVNWDEAKEEEDNDDYDGSNIGVVAMSLPVIEAGEVGEGAGQAPGEGADGEAAGGVGPGGADGSALRAAAGEEATGDVGSRGHTQDCARARSSRQEFQSHPSYCN